MSYFIRESNKIFPESLPLHGNRSWKVTTPPATEPVSTDELKFFARIDGTYEDTILENIIKQVREQAELYLGRALITQTITLVMDWWPNWVIELPRPPLIDITSISTLDEDGNKTTYSSDNYYTDTNAEPGKIIIKNGATAPENTSRLQSGYEIIYRAGYGSSSDVPEPIRTGLLEWATWVYENRKPSGAAPKTLRSSMDLYRIIRI